MRPDSCFIEFARSEIDQSVADRFEKQAILYPHHLAVKTKLHQLTYDDFNHRSDRLTVIDFWRILSAELADRENIRYIAVGCSDDDEKNARPLRELWGGEAV